jgi:hypothetical protein
MIDRLNSPTRLPLSSGTLTFAAGETSKTIVVPTLDDGKADPTRGFTVNLSNATGGSIVTGQAIGTILDDTKFYVADGGAQTYQYASAGAQSPRRRIRENSGRNS